MPTELPVLRIHDTDFFVDLRGMQFIQVDQPANCIRFDDVQYEDNSCLILYDTSTKNAFQGIWTELCQSETVVEVRLPSLEELDPPTLAALVLETQYPDDELSRAAKAFQQINDPQKHESKHKKKR